MVTMQGGAGELDETGGERGNPRTEIENILTIDFYFILSVLIVLSSEEVDEGKIQINKGKRSPDLISRNRNFC